MLGKDRLRFTGLWYNIDLRGATLGEKESLIPLFALLVGSGIKVALKFDGSDPLIGLNNYTADRELARELTIHTDASGKIGYGFQFELYGLVVVKGYGGWPKEVKADKAKMSNPARFEAEAIKLALLALSKLIVLPPNQNINIKCDNQNVVDTINGDRDTGEESMEINQIRELYPMITLTAEHLSRGRNRKADKLSKMTEEPTTTLLVYPSNGPAIIVNTVRAIETGGASNNDGTGDAASTGDTGGAGYSRSSGSTSVSSSSGDTGSTGDKGATNSGSGSGSDASVCEQAAGSDSNNEGASAANPTVTDTD